MLKSAWFLIAVLSAMVNLVTSTASAKVISDPRGPSINAIGAVVFVHGLFGDPVESFTNQETHAAWPQLLREDNYSLKHGGQLSDYDVVLLQNDTAVGSPLNLEELTLRAMRQLIDDKVFDTYETVIFVCHSLGGLLIKNLFEKLSVAYPDYAARVKAIVLISVPSQGASIANLMRTVFGHYIVGQVGRPILDLTTLENNTFLMAQENIWKARMDRRVVGRPHISLAYETLPTYGVALVVNAVYANTTYDGERIAEPADHFSIVKPANRDSDIYRWVRARIDEVSPDWIGRGHRRKAGVASGLEKRLVRVRSDGERDLERSVQWAIKDGGLHGSVLALSEGSDATYELMIRGRLQDDAAPDRQPNQWRKVQLIDFEVIEQSLGRNILIKGTALGDASFGSGGLSADELEIEARNRAAGDLRRRLEVAFQTGKLP
jgi:hypothetical protein